FAAAPYYEAPAHADHHSLHARRSSDLDGALQDTQTLAIVVGNVNEAPVITSNGGGDTATLTVMENTVVVGAVAASDPEGPTTYSIAGGADADKFTIRSEKRRVGKENGPGYGAAADAEHDTHYGVVGT